METEAIVTVTTGINQKLGFTDNVKIKFPNLKPIRLVRQCKEREEFHPNQITKYLQNKCKFKIKTVSYNQNKRVWIITGESINKP